LTGEEKSKTRRESKKCPVGRKAAGASKNKIGRVRRKKYAYKSDLHAKARK
jgi:hypothetical protein